MATDSLMEDAPPVTTDRILQPPSAVEQWGRKALFDYSPIQNILEDDEDRETFKKAKISGKAFLECGDDQDFWKSVCKLPAVPSYRLAKLVQTIKDRGKEESRGNAFHLGSVEPANTFTVQSPLTPWDGKLRPPSVVERSTEKEFMGIGRSARLWEITNVTEAERDELIKSENSRAVCAPKAIAN
jgi:hypothetical protein